MIFRFTLSHSILGSLEINPPDGWEDANLRLERHKDFHSLIEYFEGSFIFYGNDGQVNGGSEFIKQVIKSYGFDADLFILIELSFDGYSYEEVFNGLLKLDASRELEDNLIEVPIVRNDFWNKFITRMETPVDIQDDQSLDGEDVDNFGNINIIMTSQKLQKRSLGYEVFYLVDDWIRNDINDTFFTGDYIQLSFSDFIELDELNERYNLPRAINTERPVSIFDAIEDGEYNFDISIGFIVELRYISNIEFTTSSGFVSFYLQKNNETPIPLNHSLETYPGILIPEVPEVDSFRINIYSLNQTLSLVSGDLIRVYGIIDDESMGGGGAGYSGSRILIAVNEGGPEDPGGLAYYDITSNRTFLNITGQTTYKETTSSAVLLHDVGGQILDRIISRDGTFYSEHLGGANTLYRQYDNDGCAWKYGLVKGLQLRLYTLIEKPFFLSIKNWWDGSNPILNLGLGYETLNGRDVIRVEEKNHFYNSTTILNFSNVRDISRIYDQERIFKTVKIGYRQWQSENISGIDDPQTKHTYASRFKKTGTDLTIESEFIAASLAIETTRRTTREKSADYKFDNETFIIALNPIPVDVSPETSPEVTDYIPELDENFSSIENLLNSDSRYNSRITPARNFMRWIKYLSGGLQSYLDSVFKFTSGEGNYDMVSDMNVSDGCDEYAFALSEKQDIPVSDEYIHLPDLFEITIPLEWEDYEVIRNNRKNAIGISQTDENHIAFFIKELDYEIAKSQATISCWPVDPMDIGVIESRFNMVTCSPVTGLTVDNTIITVDSNQITVDHTEYTI